MSSPNDTSVGTIGCNLLGKFLFEIEENAITHLKPQIFTFEMFIL